MRCGLCDFGFGEALSLLPLAFESASCFAFLRGGCVGIGAGGHDEKIMLYSDADGYLNSLG